MNAQLLIQYTALPSSIWLHQDPKFKNEAFSGQTKGKGQRGTGLGQYSSEWGSRTSANQ